MAALATFAIERAASSKDQPPGILRLILFTGGLLPPPQEPLSIEQD